MCRYLKLSKMKMLIKVNKFRDHENFMLKKNPATTKIITFDKI